MQNTHKTIQVNHHSIAAAAGALKIPVAVLRQLKKAGADGFRANGNFDLLEFVRWQATKGRDFKPRESLEESKATSGFRAGREDSPIRAAIERGELCPIETQKRALVLIVSTLFVCLRQTSEIITHEVDRNRHHEIAVAFQSGFFNMLLNSVAGIAAIRSLDLPAWALAAISEGTENTFAKDESDFKKRMEIFGGILAGRTVEQIEKKLANSTAKP